MKFERPAFTDVTGSAVLLAEGVLGRLEGKTANGLIRFSRRFSIEAVVDSTHDGDDAGSVVEGKARGIPVFASLSQAVEKLPRHPDWCIVGGAFWGGRLPDATRLDLLLAAEMGISLVNGLHDFASDDPRIVRAAERSGCQIVDVRKPHMWRSLHTWSGEVVRLATPRIAVLGTDSAVGKRTTATMLVLAFRKAGVRAELIYTGQTGWMQGLAKFGVILDSLVNDFVSGEIENAIIECQQALNPDVIVIEGQSSLRHPAGPGGSTILLSGGVGSVVLQHEPARKYFHGYESLGFKVPSPQDEIRLIFCYGVKTIAVALSTRGSDDDCAGEVIQLRENLGIPVVRPLEDGVNALVDLVKTSLEGE